MIETYLSPYWTVSSLVVSGLVVAIIRRVYVLPRPICMIFGNPREYKMMLLIRQDLKMSKGKIIAQCCHGALEAYKAMSRRSPDILREWEYNGQPKITLRIQSLEEMLDLKYQADKHRIYSHIVQDAGRTQVESGAKTVLVLGPAPAGTVDQITGHLKLY